MRTKIKIVDINNSTYFDMQVHTKKMEVNLLLFLCVKNKDKNLSFVLISPPESSSAFLTLDGALFNLYKRCKQHVIDEIKINKIVHQLEKISHPFFISNLYSCWFTIVICSRALVNL